MKLMISAVIGAMTMLTLAISSSAAPPVTMPDMSTVVTPDIANNFIGTIVSIVPLLLPIVLTLIIIGVIIGLIKKFAR